MKEHIETMLRPFVNALNKQIGSLKDQFKTEKYHFGYGFSLYGTENWKSNYDLKYLDFLIDTKDPIHMANLDILLEDHISGEQRANMRFNTSLHIEDDLYKIIATSSRVDGQFTIDTEQIEKHGFTALASSVIKKEIGANPFIENR